MTADLTTAQRAAGFRSPDYGGLCLDGVLPAQSVEAGLRSMLIELMQ